MLFLVDRYRRGPPGVQLIDLITARRKIGPMPTHCVYSDGKALPVFGSGGAAHIGPPLRADLLGPLAEYPTGAEMTDLENHIDLMA